ncbi:MAG TPA: SDR family NAD(P)-dependent oxidoreductase [Gammaproteobacteria bacterium]|jgi:NAD(P)-dependent dehydrogenase (short-subunit alcohol dehydrogenase family)|nr:SDR family NAD(P)-dependent oxidoreductase [Gammaproteobacteria bacterium]
MQIDTKVAVVTGGASGLGKATARMLRDAGARVAILDRNADEGRRYAAELGDDMTLFVAADVTDEASATAAIDAVVSRFGQIDICVNCAGVAGPSKVLDRQGQAQPLAKYASVIGVNLIGTFNIMRLCVEQMGANELEDGEERGVVVNVASGAAFDGQIGQCAYASSKAGIVGLSLPAARELGPLGIRVNAIAPGLFLTEMVAALGDKVVTSLVETIEAPRRTGDPAEFAHLVKFLIENRYMNGECVRIDAATRMRAR